MVGAPVLNGTASALISVLNACLVDGFGLVAADSLVVDGGFAKFNVGAGHTFSVGTVVRIAGATPAGLNGDHTLTSVSINQIQWSTVLGDQTAGGTISAKRAPCGFDSPYTGTDLAVYRSSSTDALGDHCLRVDDSNAYLARVRAYESMSGVSIGDNQFPDDSQASGGGYWAKSNAGSSPLLSRQWVVIGDNRLFYFWCIPYQPTDAYSGSIYAFGDAVQLTPVDTSCVVLSVNSSDANTCSANNNNGCVGLHMRTSAGAARHFMARDVSQISISRGTASKSFAGNENGPNNAPSGSDQIRRDPNDATQMHIYPNSVDSSLILMPAFFFERPLGIRAMIPGVYHCPADVRSFFSSQSVIDGQGALAGRKLIALRVGGMTETDSFGNASGRAFIDITGPWR